MKCKVKLFLLLLVALISSQATAQSIPSFCQTKPRTIYLESKDSTTSLELKKELREAKRLLSGKKGEKNSSKIHINVYSQANWGSSGLTSVTRSVKDFAKSYLKKDQFDVVAAGHRQEAALDIFVINLLCRTDTEAITSPTPDTSFEEVDFPDAPLGLSVFPSRDEMKELIVKNVPGLCLVDCMDNLHLSFFVIVNRDGKVMSTWPGSISSEYPIYVRESFRAARQALSSWSFKPVVKEGVPRFIRGRVTVMVFEDERDRASWILIQKRARERKRAQRTKLQN